MMNAGLMQYLQIGMRHALCAILTALPTAGLADAARLSATNRHGSVELVMEAAPPVVRLDQDLLLTVRVTAPENVTVRLPDIAPRLTGFDMAGDFTRMVASPPGMRVQEYHFRLTPAISDEYRLGPLAVAYAAPAPGGAAPAEDWMITRPLVFNPPARATDAGVGDIIGPRRIMPPLRTVLKRAAWALLAALGLLALLALLRRARLAWRLRQMSPRQRALYELEQLLASKLREHGRQKEFYAALAMIVRRYIERAHAIRAPEQTTEEFLLAVNADARFTRAALDKLSEFLQTADLVKFAAWQPAADVAQRAVATARDYIQAE